MALFVFLFSGARLGAGETNLALPEGFSLWQGSATLRAGLGYKDNVMLSSYQPMGSAFETASADAMLYRLPWNDWQLTLYAYACDTRYFNSEIPINTEQNAMVMGQLSWFLKNNWKSVSTLQYTYINQVMDVSTTYGTSSPQEVIGHGINFREGMRKEMTNYWFEGAVFVSRYYFKAPLDNYWQAGPQVTLARKYGRGSELSLSLQTAPMSYDTREQTDLSGASITNTHLSYLQNSATLGWTHYWDQKQHWRTSTGFTFEWNTDNGTGYYNYYQYRISEQLRYRPSNWEISAQCSLALYQFPNQTVSEEDLRSRQRMAFLVTLRAERTLSKHWKLFATYDYDLSISNVDMEEYKANTVSAGAEYTF